MILNKIYNSYCCSCYVEVINNYKGEIKQMLPTMRYETSKLA